MSYFDKEHLLNVNYGTTDDYYERSLAWDKFQNEKINVVDKALKYLDFGKDKVILDAGCGLGRFSLAAAELMTKNSKIFAVDISQSMLNIVDTKAKNNDFNIETINCSIEKLPFSDEYFDEIYCNLVLYHVEDIEFALAQLKKSLKKEGKIIFLVPEFRWLTELIDWQDRALLSLGYKYDDILLAPTGTDRFCKDNANLFISKIFNIEKIIEHNGSMTFPTSQEILDYYSHSMRFKNVIARDHAPKYDVLLNKVHALILDQYPTGINIPLSSYSYIYYCNRS